jgi:hypothetical protein
MTKSTARIDVNIRPTAAPLESFQFLRLVSFIAKPETGWIVGQRSINLIRFVIRAMFKGDYRGAQ